jgi:hypothetical protein
MKAMPPALVGSEMKWTDDRPFTHPSAQGITATLVEGLRQNFFIKRRRRIIFVCGGPTSSAALSDRANFLNWAQSNIADEAHLLLAEKAYGAATERGTKFINLADFEKILAELSDCVLIFPESVGSFSEVGIFATAKSIRDKTLIANDSKHERRDSFLLLGPYHEINEKSHFNPSVNYDSTLGPDPAFHQRIWDRISIRTNGFGKRKRPETVHFVDMPLASRVAIVSWVINITARAKFGDLLDIVRAVYGPNDKDAQVLKQTLAVLVALDQISTPVTDLFRTRPKHEFSLDVPVKVSKLKAQFRSFWIGTYPKLWSY